MWMWSGEAQPSKQAAAFSPFTYKLFLNRFYIDEVYQFAIDKIVLAAGRVVAVFDRTVVNDTGVNGTGDATWGLGFAGKFQETGKIPNYAFAIVAGIVIIVAIAFGYRA